MIVILLHTDTSCVWITYDTIISTSDWDTSRVTDLYETFSYAESFDGDISRWDVSKVTKMFGLFNGK